MGVGYKTFQHITAGDMSGNISGAPIDATNVDALQFQCIWTGTPTGNVTIQASEDGGTTWTELDSMTEAAGGAASNHIFTVWAAVGKAYRCYYDFTGSTGVLNVYVTKKDI